MIGKKYFVYLGYSGFPYGLSENQKIILISKCLMLTGNEVTVICKKSVINKTEHPEFKGRGEFQGIKYIYTNGSPFRESNFLIRNSRKFRSVIKELIEVRNMVKNNKLDFAILSTHKFLDVLFYYSVSRMLKFKIALNYVEFSSGIPKKPFKIISRLNDALFDKYAPKLADLVLPISEFLINQIEIVSPGKKYLKIPGLTDFEKYNDIPAVASHKYFLFCGSTAYSEIITFIIDSYVQLDTTESNALYLVINGPKVAKSDIQKYIDNTNRKKQIRILSNLPEKELFTYYNNAMALLIPLRPTLQDIARFPHKIGEYMASGNPVISTNYGEVRYYFKDMETMLLADSYDAGLFAQKMQFVIDNPNIANSIGIEGKTVARKLFDFRAKAAEIDNFFSEQIEE